MKDIIVSTWGVGESYRNRIKHNISKAFNTGYDNILPYIILTDKPSDFFQLQEETEKIIDIIDINKAREIHSPWSEKYEYIPQIKDEKNFGRDFREKNYKEKKYFSYGLHRFSLPYISDLGYKKILFCDSDTDIRYDKIVDKTFTEENFWKEFDTPVNSMKGCDYEKFEMWHGDWNKRIIILSNILRYALHKVYPKYQKKKWFSLLKLDYIQTEGPFRFYNLESTEMVLEYFKLWDLSMEIAMKELEFRNQLSPGCYMFIDNVFCSTANEMLGITVLNFPKTHHKVNIYREDRYFFPQGVTYLVNDKFLSLLPADSKEEFYKINKELIDFHKSRGDWPE